MVSLNPHLLFLCVLTESTGVFCLFSLNPEMLFVCVLTESTGVFLFVFSLHPYVLFVCVLTESTGVFLFVFSLNPRGGVQGETGSCRYRGCSFTQVLGCEKEDLVCDPFRDGQPVQRPQDG